MNRLQLPVGYEFEYTKEKGNLPELHHARVVEMPNDPRAWEKPCVGCIFVDAPKGFCDHVACSSLERTDVKNVKFVEVRGGEE